MPRFILLATLAVASIAAGCRGKGAAEAVANPPVAAPRPASPGTAHPPSSPASAALVPGTPEGGLARWIADVRRGLGGVLRLAAKDRAAAQKAALELYLSRQEYIEMYWGSAGKLTRGPELPAAVKEAETRFHAILEQLQPGKTVDSARLRELTASLDEQYGQVLSAASRAGVRVDPHAGATGAAAERAGVRDGPGGADAVPGRPGGGR